MNKIRLTLLLIIITVLVLVGCNTVLSDPNAQTTSQSEFFTTPTPLTTPQQVTTTDFLTTTVPKTTTTSPVTTTVPITTTAPITTAPVTTSVTPPVPEPVPVGWSRVPLPFPARLPLSAAVRFYPLRSESSHRLTFSG